MARFPFQYININGIPTIEARNVVVSETSVDFQFRPDWDRNPFRGLIVVNIPAVPTGTTETLPVRFAMAGNTQPLLSAGATPVTVADLPAGVYIVYYDRYANVLQLV